MIKNQLIYFDNFFKRQFALVSMASRFMIGVFLDSLKTIGKEDLNKSSEFYFLTTRKGGKTARTPTNGNIILTPQKEYSAYDEKFSLYSEFIEFKEDEEKSLVIEVHLKEDDPLIDDKVATRKIQLDCPTSTKKVTLNSENGETKAELTIFARNTKL